MSSINLVNSVVSRQQRTVAQYPVEKNPYIENSPTGSNDNKTLTPENAVSHVGNAIINYFLPGTNDVLNGHIAKGLTRMGLEVILFGGMLKVGYGAVKDNIKNYMKKRNVDADGIKKWFTPKFYKEAWHTDFLKAAIKDVPKWRIAAVAGIWGLMKINSYYAFKDAKKYQRDENSKFRGPGHIRLG